MWTWYILSFLWNGATWSTLFKFVRNIALSLGLSLWMISCLKMVRRIILPLLFGNLLVSRGNPGVYHTAGVFIQYNLGSRVKSHVRLQLSEQLLCAAHKSSSNFSDRTCLAAFHGR